mgnify:CR=1 FL=1
MKPSLEKQYVAQAIRGDKKAFNALADHYYTDCFTKAKLILGNESLAQDVAQISLLQAYRSLEKLQNTARFKVWLLGIVRNISRNYLKQKRQAFFSLDDFSALSQASFDEKSKHLSELVTAAIQSLEAHYRDVITAFYYDGLGLSEIALRQQISPETAKVRLYRGRQMLKGKLSAHQDLYYYYREPLKKSIMKKLTIADVYLKENGSAALLLQSEGGEYFLPIIVGFFEAQAVFLGLQGIKTGRPMSHDLAVSMLDATGTTLDKICINKLFEGVFYAYLAIKHSGKTVQVDARPSDAVALAVRLNTPIYVAEEVLDEAGIPIPKAYQNTKPKGKGINKFVSDFARDKINRIIRESVPQPEKEDEKAQKSKSLEKKQTFGDMLIDLAFGDTDVPELNLPWQPRRYTSWDEARHEPGRVEWLDLKSQELTDFAEKIKPLSQVNTLELTDYGFAEMPTGIEQLPKLCQLNLSGNQLTDLPTEMEQLARLEGLNLSKNVFRELPEVVERLPALLQLDLSKNPTLFLSQALHILSRSRTIDHLALRENNLTRLPEEIKELLNLVRLELGNNPDLDLPQLFQVLHHLPSLSMLELPHLALTSLPAEVSLLQHLTGLNLSDNPGLDPTSLYQRLSHLPQLKVLILTRCGLSNLPEKLELLGKLKVLELGGNQISKEEQERIKRLLPSTTVVF